MKNTEIQVVREEADAKNILKDKSEEKQLLPQKQVQVNLSFSFTDSQHLILDN
jgi:hypothetical protein